MSRLQALRDALRPLGIYKLEKGTLVYAELAAYAAGLDLLEDGLDELEREAFLPTAQGEGISRREEIYGKPKTLLPLRERREMLLYRGAINNRNNTREDLERALVACGLRAQVKENLDGASIYINCFDFLEDFQGQEEIKAAAKEFLPCHLEAEFDFRTLDWNRIDSMDKTFDQMEAAEMTWCARSFYVGDVKKEDIHAKFEDGVLHVELPAPQQTKALPENPNLIAIE